MNFKTTITTALVILLTYGLVSKVYATPITQEVTCTLPTAAEWSFNSTGKVSATLWVGGCSDGTTYQIKLK